MQMAFWLFVRQQYLTVQCYLPLCVIFNPILAQKLTILHVSNTKNDKVAILGLLPGQNMHRCVK